MAKDTLLAVKGVNKRFGGLQALSEVGMEILRGQIYGLIGPNGAGKTTFFNAISGLVKANEKGPRAGYCIVPSAWKRFKDLLNAV